MPNLKFDCSPNVPVKINAKEYDTVRYDFDPGQMILLFSYAVHTRLLWFVNVTFCPPDSVYIEKDNTEEFEELCRDLLIGFRTESLLKRREEMKAAKNADH